ncbi:MAG: Ig-like domain-containing protein [Clostridia bacterium]|nr:Ig-like domain-containing protein [Clostridia bacterium]
MNKRSTRMLALVLTVICLMSAALPAEAAYSVRVRLSTLRASVDLSQTDKLTLTATVRPVSAAKNLVWRSDNTNIATVNKNGVVTFKKTGTVRVGARVPRKSAWSICTITVTDSTAPTSVTLSPNRLTISLGQTRQLTPVFLPAGSNQSAIWKSSKPAIASVDEDGVLTAKAVGRCYIRVRSAVDSSVKKTIIVVVKDTQAPTSIEISPGDESMLVDDTLQLSVIPYPEDASAAVTWSTSDRNVARVSAAGLVRAVAAGTVTITATSAADTSVVAQRTLTITDSSVTSLSIDQEDMYLNKGDTTRLTCTLTPSTTAATVTWSSDNTSVATVGAAGRVTAVASGTAIITASAGGFSDNIEIRVLSDERSTDLPDTYVTAASAISSNVAKMKAIYNSALDELDEHVVNNNISSTERANRKAIILRAFDMYNVPWMTDTNITYWSSSTSYRVGRIYLGMPYTQTNRTYNLTKWLDKITYTLNNGIYSVEMPNRSYPGNDCSSYVSMCQWGTNSTSSYLNTTSMYSSTSYNTISNGYTQLIPGDILVKVGHTAMFLYYVTSDRIMVIEQGGGSEPNTVACHIKSISGVYRSQGYRVRRKVGIAG